MPLSIHCQPPTPEVLWCGFENAFLRFLVSESDNIRSDVSERNLCGHLAHELKDELGRLEWHGYYVDTEYNRNQDGRVKTMFNQELQIVTITCDLIIHSRGKIVECDNLIAVEMKKSNSPAAAKEADRMRLKTLTCASYDNIWSADGKTLPKHVCGYRLGLFVEIDVRNAQAFVEEYQLGRFLKRYNFRF